MNSFLPEAGDPDILKNDRFYKVTDNDEFLKANQSKTTGSRSATPNKIKPSTPVADANSKCCSCSKSVGLKEKRIACSKTWHTDCFRCGGLVGDGCNKKLTLDNYSVHENQPYCKTCYGQQFAPKGFLAGSTTHNSFLADAGNTDYKNDRNFKITDNDEVLRARRLSNKHSGSVGSQAAAYEANSARSQPEATVCVKCSRSVGLKDQRIACDKTWHYDCFTCGGMNSDGCNRILTLDTYVVHDNEPYCKGCYGRQFAPKGFLAGSTTHNSFLPEAGNSDYKNDRNYKISDTDEFLLSGAESGGRKVRSKSGTFESPVFSSFSADVNSKCAMCAKNVGLKEQRIACGKTWHVDCFMCGGLNHDGCNKKLTLDAYTTHESQPYCKSCYGRQFAPKGFMGQSATINSFISTGDQEVLKNDRHYKVSQGDKYLNKALRTAADVDEEYDTVIHTLKTSNMGAMATEAAGKASAKKQSGRFNDLADL